MQNLSVIICTHNPRPDYLHRVLDALKAQTLPKEQWEMLVIDNASDERLEGGYDLSWHPHNRHIREDELGLTPARLRGIKESTGELLLFVDDDTVLRSDYLAELKLILSQWGMLGSVGGSIKGELEIEPSVTLKAFIGTLAISEIDSPHWSNIPTWSLAIPIGAGLCVRREIALAYAENVKADPVRTLLGRRGTNLTACEDLDLVFCGMDLGFGAGRFPSLELTHLISRHRLTVDYIVKLLAGRSASSLILTALRTGKVGQDSVIWETLRFIAHWCRARGLGRKIAWQSYLADKRARRLLREASFG